MPTASKTKEDDFATKGDLHRIEKNMVEGFVEVNKSIKDLNDVMIQSFHFVYARFDRIDERFAKIEERFNGIDEHFKVMESGMNVRFNSVNSRLDNLIGDTPKWTDHTKLEKRVRVLEKAKS